MIFKRAVAKLRAHPKLIGELRWHRSTVASFVGDMAVVEGLTRDLLSRIERHPA
jgi:hypothetical protein